MQSRSPHVAVPRKIAPNEFMRLSTKQLRSFVTRTRERTRLVLTEIRRIKEYHQSAHSLSPDAIACGLSHLTTVSQYTYDLHKLDDYGLTGGRVVTPSGTSVSSFPVYMNKLSQRPPQLSNPSHGSSIYRNQGQKFVSKSILDGLLLAGTKSPNAVYGRHTGHLETFVTIISISPNFYMAYCCLPDKLAIPDKKKYQAAVKG